MLSSDVHCFIDRCKKCQLCFWASAEVLLSIAYELAALQVQNMVLLHQERLEAIEMSR